MTRARTVGVTIVALAMVVLAGCSESSNKGGNNTAPPSSSTTPPTTVTGGGPSGSAAVASTTTSSTAPTIPGAVAIKDYAFTPGDLTIKVGDTVTWTNQDEFAHYVINADKTLDSGPLSTGQTYAKTFTTPGTYAYFCNIHNVMKATITVQ